MAKDNEILVVLSGEKPEESLLYSLLEESESLSDCVFVRCDTLDSLLDETFKRAICFVKESYDKAKLLELRKVLVPGAIVHFHAPSQVNVLRRNCLFSSFVVVESDKETMKVKKPEWEIGAKSVLAPAKKWTLDVEDDILDDDEFLTEEDLKPPVLQGGKKPMKKACDNCTCGRAEGKEPVKLTQEMLDNPVTSCGSCGLGDAYRCASCPYRGLPAFEPGKKIELPSDFLMTDA